MREFALSYIAIILLLASCNRDKQSASDEMEPLYPAPLTSRTLNTEEGYTYQSNYRRQYPTHYNFNR